VKVRDSLGRELELPSAPSRIVSLVPSWTETLFHLGAGDRVVGVTDYCVHPAGSLARVARVGGTKNPALVRVLSLRPDLVLANKEENRARDVERLEANQVPVFVTDARSVRGAVLEIRALGTLVQREAPAQALVAEIERSLERARRRVRAPRPWVVALVWKAPFMAVSRDTFAHALLAECGARNPFENEERRYPRIEIRDLEAARPDVLLLPTEPYAFGDLDRQELLGLDCPAARSGRIHVVEGELLSWYGPRIPRALDTFSSLLFPSAPDQAGTTRA
jgi:ABC-type Fe3+-hydroxamate transport system substrate-binding protein